MNMLASLSSLIEMIRKEAQGKQLSLCWFIIQRAADVNMHGCACREPMRQVVNSEAATCYFMTSQHYV